MGNSKGTNAENIFVSSRPENPSFHADTGHWYLSIGVTHINGVPVIQRSSPSELLQEEQRGL
jgi:hypothetical protein